MSMLDTSTSAFHRGTAPIFQLLTPEQKVRLTQLQGDPSIAKRIEELADKASESELTAAERAEYEAYIEANNLLTILQSEARYWLHSQAGPQP